LADQFNGLTVTGTFDYDSATSAGPTLISGPLAGSVVYFNSTMNLNGSVGTNSFSGSIGGALVGNDRFSFFTPSTDIFSVIWDQSLFTGFDILGFTLVGARMEWIEGQLGIGDFLSDESLPGLLPNFQGRLALVFDHVDHTNHEDHEDQAFWTVNFNDLVVTQVPEPTTLSLLALGLLGFGFSRRKGTV
jgi:hypothetical protein